jgi:hypothetical protein
MWRFHIGRFSSSFFVACHASGSGLPVSFGFGSIGNCCRKSATRIDACTQKYIDLLVAHSLPLAGARERQHRFGLLLGSIIGRDEMKPSLYWGPSRGYTDSMLHAARLFPSVGVLYVSCLSEKGAFVKKVESGLGDLWNLACKRFPISQIMVLRIWPVKLGDPSLACLSQRTRTAAALN